jgi:hypothetical protein
MEAWESAAVEGLDSMSKTYERLVRRLGSGLGNPSTFIVGFSALHTPTYSKDGRLLLRRKGCGIPARVGEDAEGGDGPRGQANPGRSI